MPIKHATYLPSLHAPQMVSAFDSAAENYPAEAQRALHVAERVAALSPRANITLSHAEIGDPNNPGQRVQVPSMIVDAWRVNHREQVAFATFRPDDADHASVQNLGALSAERMSDADAITRLVALAAWVG